MSGSETKDLIFQIQLSILNSQLKIEREGYIAIDSMSNYALPLIAISRARIKEISRQIEFIEKELLK